MELAESFMLVDLGFRLELARAQVAALLLRICKSLRERALIRCGGALGWLGDACAIAVLVFRRVGLNTMKLSVTIAPELKMSGCSLF